MIMMVVVDFNHRPTTLNLDQDDNIMMMITMMMVMIMIMMMVVAGYLKRRLTHHTGKGGSNVHNAGTPPNIHHSLGGCIVIIKKVQFCQIEQH